ncbi:hypothetical protein [Paenibacillus brasilensis]|nr:hypothetical protein [Paenibacillus brasilensis]
MARTLGKEYKEYENQNADIFTIKKKNDSNGGINAAVAIHFMPCYFGCYDYEEGVCRPCRPGDHG